MIKIGSHVYSIASGHNMPQASLAVKVEEETQPMLELPSVEVPLTSSCRRRWLKSQPCCANLDTAYQALESMRRTNLQLECEELGREVDFDVCTTCLLQVPRPAPLARWRQWLARRPEPCLLCSSPTCLRHRSPAFAQKSAMTVCIDCESLFADATLEAALASPEEAHHFVRRLLNVYDRTRLILEYATQFTEDLASAVEQEGRVQTRIRMGSSSAGVVSGALGLAAAAVGLAPVGSPLVLASLLFGSSAAAVQSTAEVYEHVWSEPHQAADRILALASMAQSLVGLISVWRDTLLHDGVQSDLCATGRIPTTIEIPSQPRQVSAARLEFSSTAASTSLIALGRSARLLSRASASTLHTLRAARVAGGALAAGTLALEATSLVAALQRRRPTKADRLRHVSVDRLPTTAQLEADWQETLAIVSLRQRSKKQLEFVDLWLEASESSLDDDDPVFLTEYRPHPNDADSVSSVPGDASTVASSTSRSSELSLLERIALHKQQERLGGW